MPPKNCDPAATPVSATPIGPATGDGECPKCGAAMEPIEIGVEGLRLHDVQLCPHCYLVTWRDSYGMYSLQGVPMKKGFEPPSESLMGIDLSRRTHKPEEC